MRRSLFRRRMLWILAGGLLVVAGCANIGTDGGNVATDFAASFFRSALAAFLL